MRFSSNELKARRSVPTHTVTCNKQITYTQQGQQYAVHTRGVKGREIAITKLKGKHIFMFFF